MFARTNTRRGWRGLAALLDNPLAAPLDDPLLFLYPRWFTSALRQERPITSMGARVKAGDICDNGLTRTSGFTARIGNPSRRWISPSAAFENLAEDTKRLTSLAAGDFDPHNAVRYDDILEPTRRESPPSLSVNNLNAEEKRAASRLFADIDPLQIEPTRKALYASLPDDQERSRSPVHRLPLHDMKKLRRRLFFLKTSGTSDHGSRRAQLADLRNLLEKLDQDSHEWTVKRQKRKELLLLEETIVLLTGFSETAIRENVWYVPVHNGCRVHVLDPRESEGPYRKVVLYGSPNVVELVAHRITHLQKRQASGDPLIDVRTPPVPMYPSTERARRMNLPVPLVRGVWDSYMGFRPKPLHAVLALRNSLTTVKEFGEFVEDLTRSQPSRHQSRGTRRTHPDQVAETLVALFKDETMSKLFSSAALDQALMFLYKHEFRNSARVVFLKASHVATAATFNILLKGAARWLDLASFRSFIIAMRRFRIRPNEWTWLALLDCYVTNKGKTNLVAYLLHKDYLTMDSLRCALHMTIQGLFSAHLESGLNVDSFLNMMINTKTLNWFSVSILNQLFSVISKRRDYYALDRLLDICEEQGLAVGSSTINHAVGLYRSSILKALPCVLRIMGRGVSEVQLESGTFEKLFKMAYKDQRYNVCRVLWRYACMYRRVTYKMQAIVLDSLACNRPPTWGTDTAKRFEMNAGKAIVGVSTLKGIKYHAVINDLPPEFRDNALLYLVSSTRRNCETDASLRRRVARAIVSHDMKVGSHYRPVLPLPLMLHASMIVDGEWEFNPRPISWFLQNALHVPVEASERRLSESDELI